MPALGGRLRSELLHRVGLDRARADRVAGDAPGAVLGRHGLGEAVDGVLVGDVVADRGLVGLLAFDRGNVDDPPPAALEHVPQRAAGAPEHRVQVPVERVLPRLVAHLVHQREPVAAAGVVHQDVRAAVPLGGLVDQVLHVLLAAHVAGHEHRAVADAHLLQGLLALVLRLAAHDHGGALRDEGLGDAAADAARAAGDHGDPLVQEQRPSGLRHGQLLFFDVGCSAAAHAVISFRTRWKCWTPGSLRPKTNSLPSMAARPRWTPKPVA